MADTKLTLYDMEIAIARSHEFNYIKNLVVFNVQGWSGILPLYHECDVLVCTKTGYLTEIEIKRSYTDFVNDFKKRHNHYSKHIKNFYYCIPEKIYDKVVEYFRNYEDQSDWRIGAGIIVIKENRKLCEMKAPTKNKEVMKLNLEQMFYMARLGSMRVITLKDKVNKMNKNGK